VQIRKSLLIAGGLFAILLLAVAVVLTLNLKASAARAAQDTASAQANPVEPPVEIGESDLLNTTFILAPSFRPERFVQCVDNPYFPLVPGTVYHYETLTDEGLETVTVTVTQETKEILGIQATVVRDTVEIEGELKEDTFDWFAQDDRGNVWYLGEDTKEYENGEVVSTEGSWEAGVDGAVAGIIMEGQPRAGDIYRQEFFAGEAEDMAGVLSRSESVTVPFGSFERVLKTVDYNPLGEEGQRLEHKFYAPGVGLVETVPVEGDGQPEQLVSVTHEKPRGAGRPECGAIGEDNGEEDETSEADDGEVLEDDSITGSIPVSQGQTDLQSLATITAEEAGQAALAANQGAQFTEVVLEAENGYLVYEVALDSGMEVIVDAGNGEILHSEKDD
jgi:uncharacterized membrane protein YkoI